MNSPEIKKFIKDRSYLFWYIKEEEKENISTNVLVEFILNYGNEKDIKGLFDLVGIRKAAEIFREQISRKRVNYHKRTINFFNLYFEKNAH